MGFWEDFKKGLKEFGDNAKRDAINFCNGIKRVFWDIPHLKYDR